jgi:RNA polymerase sigma factor (sigma-70 family)
MRVPWQALFALLQTDHPSTDEELLGRFAQAQDEEAFSILVRRHGPLVWRACCRVLGQGPDAEDAFQVTFLTLARWARKLRRGELAGWLFQVARRAAQDLRAAAGRRRGLERNLSVRPGPGPEEEPDRAETYRLLDEELAGLPEKLRVPLVLRYLEGKTLEDVARILGCSRRAVGKRLARGEGILRERLSCRGVAVGVGAVLSLLGGSATAAPAVSSRLVAQTTRAAMAFCAGTLDSAAARTALGLLPGKVGGGLKSWLIVLLGIGALLAGAIGWGLRASAPAGPPDADSPPASPVAGPRLDRPGDPLPRGALARLGTLRWQQEAAGQGDFAQPVALFADGKQFLSAGRCQGRDDRPLHVWDLATGKIVRSLGRGLGRDGPGRLPVGVTVGALAPDGRLAVIRGPGMALRLWDLAADRERHRWDGPDVPWLPAAFAPDGRSLVLAGRLAPEGSPVLLHLFAADTGKELQCFRGTAGAVQRAVFTPDGRTLVAAGVRSVYRWEVASGKETSHFVFERNRPLAPLAVALSADGGTLAFSNASRPGEIAVWDVQQGKEVRRWRSARPGEILWLALSPDGRTLASVAWSRSAAFALWDTATGKELSGGDNEGYRHVVFSADGRTLVCPRATGSGVTLLEVPSGRERQGPPAHREALRGVLPVGQDAVLTWTRSHADVVLWERATGKQVRRFPVSADACVVGAAVSPDGATVAVAQTSKNGRVGLRLWDRASGRAVWSAEWAGNDVWDCGLAFTPNGKRVAADAGRGIRIWDCGTGKPVAELRHPPGPVGYLGLHFSRDGRRLLAWRDSWPGRPQQRLGLCFWDVDGGKVVRRLEVSGVALGAVVSPDGAHLACVADSTEVAAGEVAERQLDRCREG